MIGEKNLKDSNASNAKAMLHLQDLICSMPTQEV